MRYRYMVLTETGAEIRGTCDGFTELLTELNRYASTKVMYVSAWSVPSSTDRDAGPNPNREAQR